MPGEIDAFELDGLIHRYKRSAQKLWSFCGQTGSEWLNAARTLEYWREHGQAAADWWAAGEPRNRRWGEPSGSGLNWCAVKPFQGERRAANRLLLPKAADRSPQPHCDPMVVELEDGRDLVMEVPGPNLPVEHDGVAYAQLCHRAGGANRIQQRTTSPDRVGDRHEMRVQRPGRDCFKQRLLGKDEPIIVMIWPQH
jgi:hypothetical protein